MPSYWNGKWLGANTNSDSELMGKTSPTSSLNRCMVKDFFFQRANHPFIVISSVQYLRFYVPKCKQILYYMRFDTLFHLCDTMTPFSRPRGICMLEMPPKWEPAKTKTCWIGELQVWRLAHRCSMKLGCTHDAIWNDIRSVNVKSRDLSFGLLSHAQCYILMYTFVIWARSRDCGTSDAVPFLKCLGALQFIQS